METCTLPVVQKCRSCRPAKLSRPFIVARSEGELLKHNSITSPVGVTLFSASGKSKVPYPELYIKYIVATYLISYNWDDFFSGSSKPIRRWMVRSISTRVAPSVSCRLLTSPAARERAGSCNISANHDELVHFFEFLCFSNASTTYQSCCVIAVIYIES